MEPTGDRTRNRIDTTSCCENVAASEPAPVAYSLACEVKNPLSACLIDA
jgi:hypothetical protein